MLRTKLLNVQLRTCGYGLRKLKFGCGFADCGLKKKFAVPSTGIFRLPYCMLLACASFSTTSSILDEILIVAIELEKSAYRQ